MATRSAEIDTAEEQFPALRPYQRKWRDLRGGVCLLEQDALFASFCLTNRIKPRFQPIILFVRSGPAFLGLLVGTLGHVLYSKIFDVATG